MLGCVVLDWVGIHSIYMLIYSFNYSLTYSLSLSLVFSILSSFLYFPILLPLLLLLHLPLPSFHLHLLFLLHLFCLILHLLLLLPGRHKGEDKSLCFEIVPAQPLLTLFLQGLNCPLSLPPSPPTPPSSSSLFPSQPLPRTTSSQTNSSSSSSSTHTKESDILLLQGQILESVLTIKNDGAAPASEIFVKFSHPNIILSKITTENHGNNQTYDNGFELEPLYGRSGTVLKLLSTDNQPLLPGCEVKYRFFLRLTEIEKHRVSVIASCVCKNSGLESGGPQSHEAPTTPGFGGQGGQGLGPIPRTSIISFQVRIRIWLCTDIIQLSSFNST